MSGNREQQPNRESARDGEPQNYSLGNELNRTTAMAAAQEMAREILSDKLMVKLLEILRKTTPATKICLLEKQDEQWTLLAAYPLDSNPINILPSSSPGEIPSSIINYVAQTGSSLILKDAANVGEFMNEPEVRQQQLKSILCLPLPAGDLGSRVIYLENNRITGAFTPQLENNLALIANQAAISLTNAQKYQQVAEKAQRLEQQLKAQTQQWQEKLRHQETALQASQAELSGILDIAKDAIISVDREQRICRFNQGAEKIFGYKAEEVVGKSLDLLLPRRAIDAHHQNIQDFGSNSVVSAKMMGERRGVYGRRRDGTEFPAEASISKLQLGQQLIYTAILRDISDRKVVEADLQQAKEAAESANRAKSEFLANMSHELRTPLNAILGFTQLLTRDSALNSSQQEYLGIISQSGEHLLELINDILTMSKIEAGQMTLKENSFDLYRWLDSLEEMLRLRAQFQGLELIFARAPEVPQYIRSDDHKLRQILINLLGNAIKFTQTGWVRLRVGVRLENQEQPNSTDNQLLFEVEDIGPGIAPEEIDSLFQAFAQTKAGRNSQEGTGLGLSISRQFIQLLGGDITLSSKLGRGTRVKFEIPLRLAETTEVSPKRAPKRVIGLAPNQSEYRILVVEDNLTSRQLLGKLLESVGFAVREAENGQQALAEWDSWSPHLIWMDMRMPVMDGYEATERIKSTIKGQGTAILALTASVFDEERTIVLSSGCDDFVRKPFREEVIFEKMAEHLGVKYLYAAESSEAEKLNDWSAPSLIQASALAVMPPEWLSQLQKASAQAKDKLVRQLLEEIPESQASLAQSLSDLVDNFHFDKIIELTRPFL